MVLAAATAASLPALGGERALWDEASKVFLAKVVELGGHEDAPGSNPSMPFRYQRIRVKDAEVFKGPAQPPKFGYETVLLPIRGKRNGHFLHLARALTWSDLPDDRQILLFLARDPQGAWTLSEGSESLFRRPGRARLEILRAWKSGAPPPAAGPAWPKQLEAPEPTRPAVGKRPVRPVDPPGPGTKEPPQPKSPPPGKDPLDDLDDFDF